MTTFGAGSWLFIAAIVIFKIIVSATKTGAGQEHNWLKTHGLTFDKNLKHRVCSWVVVCVVVFTLLATQFWAFFRLRQFQSEMIEAAGGKFPDEQWTFGQIVAVVVFLPVAIEVLFQWSKEK
jgi:magnesium-transporting ATPase (P-type)